MAFEVLQYRIQHWLKAVDEQSLHSPSLFQLYQILAKKNSASFDEIEKIRKQLREDKQTIEVTDLGAGSKMKLSNKRKISSIAKSSLNTAFWSETIFNLIEHFKPSTIVELGTSLGINTLYLASANPNAKTISFEGCPEIARIALSNFNKFPNLDIQIIQGNIDQTLPLLLQKQADCSFFYIDANHTYEATKRYFELIISNSTADSILIFDDIHWSSGMHRAWQEIVQHPKAQLSIDLFKIGLIFTNPELPKSQQVWELRRQSDSPKQDK
ncbi:O-methyltransferase [Peijinzhouia sedimentorum]